MLTTRHLRVAAVATMLALVAAACATRGACALHDVDGGRDRVETAT